MQQLCMHSTTSAWQGQQQQCRVQRQPMLAGSCQQQPHRQQVLAPVQQQQHTTRVQRHVSSRRPAVALRADTQAAPQAAPAVGSRLGAAYSEDANMPDWHKGRRAGVILHPTSLPGPNGIGELGAEAFKFVDWLNEAGMQCWQVRPASLAGTSSAPASGSAQGPHCLSTPHLAFVQQGYQLTRRWQQAVEQLCQVL